MKTYTYLLAVIFLSITLHTRAQTGSRLVAWAAYINFNVNDSAYYTYTGSNGGDLTHTLNYSNQTIYGYNPNPGADSFYTYSAVQETFNANGTKSDSLTQYWDTTHWVNEWRTLFNYDSGNHDTLAYYQTSNGTQWTGSVKTFYHYANNRIDTVTVEDSSYTGGWVGYTKTSYAYNSSGHISDEVIEYWNTGNNSWSNFINTQFLYYYDSFNNDTTLLVQRYDTTETGSWVNDYKLVYTYDANSNPITEVNLAWNVNIFDTSSVGSLYYNYDANNNDTSDFELNYNQGLQQWDTIIRNSYTYNAYNQVTYHKYYNVNLFLPYTENKYYYSDFSTGVDQLPVNNNQLAIYPNPTSGQLSITSKQLRIKEITITNLLGQVAYRSPLEDLGVTEQTINVSDLPDGLYFITINTNTRAVTQKFVVSR